MMMLKYSDWKDTFVEKDKRRKVCVFNRYLQLYMEKMIWHLTARDAHRNL